MKNNSFDKRKHSELSTTSNYEINFGFFYQRNWFFPINNEQQKKYINYVSVKNSVTIK